MEISLAVTLAVLGGAMLHASWNALVKSSADKQLDTAAISAGAGLLALGAMVWLPAPAPASYPWLAASAVVHIFYFALLADAYRWGDLSFTYPVMRGGGPVIVALVGSLVLGESLPSAQTLGILLICAGVLAFATVRTHDPVALRRALGFALGNAAVVAAYTIIDAQGARASGEPVSYALWFFFANGVAVPAWFALHRGRAVADYFARHWPRALLGGACTLGSYGIALWAMTQAPIALVAALRETSVIFGALLGALFLGERFTRRRLVATVAVLAGLVALRA
ncbi:MAG: DMT family transporter [Betaproteobacteria bacterium]|nr:DMT family transporter [Betaproteobacteria bacterium]